MAKKVRKKKYNPRAKAKEFMSGVVSTWQVDDPLSETRCLTDTNMYHENPLNNMLLIDKGERVKVYKAITQNRYKWKVEITAYFDSGLETSEEYRVFIFTGLISDGDEAWAQVLEEIFESPKMDYYIHTTMKCTIMGTAPIKESDYISSMVPIRKKYPVLSPSMA